jgi:hypothetical protein
MANPGGAGTDLSAGDLLDVAAPLVEAGASWVVFGWPVDLAQLAEAARTLRSV